MSDNLLSVLPDRILVICCNVWYPSFFCSNLSNFCTAISPGADLSYNKRFSIRLIYVVVVGFYDTFKHLRSSASLPT